MKRLLVILLFCLAALPAEAQKEPKTPQSKQYGKRDVSHYGFEIDGSGDTVTVVYVNRIVCFAKPMDMSRHWKMVRDFRKVYPLALVAKEKMAGYEQEILRLPTRKAQREYSKQIEKQLVEEYTPQMKRMTVNQGKILVRLIDRETDKTSYEIVKEFRGGFVAGFWQGIAKMFGHDLKDEYDAVDRDRMIEQCIIMYNAGLLPEY